MTIDSAIRSFEELVSAARATREASARLKVPGTEWLTADEAVAYLGFPSRKSLYQAIRRGQVPVHRLGRRLRFHRPEIDRFLLTHVA